MEKYILENKLHIPYEPQKLVPRSRLWSNLEHNISNFRLVLISAPAGYGKTTLLAQWAHTSRFLIAWFSISKEDNDPERFLRYLLAAWEVVQPGIVNTSMGILLGSQMPDIEAVLPAFIHAGNETSEHVVFVLDDYHLIEDPEIHAAVGYILDHLPAKLHFILATRSEPPLSLARYRARRQLFELRADNLQFTLDESADFLRQVAELDLTQNEVASLHAGTEGWIAGLQLAALSLQHRSAVFKDLPSVSSQQRFIADYLAEDVFSQLPASLQDFLLKTSILERLYGPLCEAVTGEPGGQASLETLERRNLFIVPMDDRQEWFRYHSLFAEFLQVELQRRLSSELDQLHGRAARWYIDHDLPDQAFTHALAAGNKELTIQIAERYLIAKFWRGEYKTIGRWLESLPEDWYASYPPFGLVRAGILAFSGDFVACARCLDQVEQNLENLVGEEVQWQMARVNAIRCATACMQKDLVRAEAYADLALQDLPADDLFFQEAINLSLGDTYRQIGRWEEAKQHYLRAFELTHHPPIRFRSIHALGALADLSLRQGLLRRALGYWREALAIIQEQESWGSVPLPVTGWVHVRMGEVLYEWNELTEAWEHLTQGLKYAELGGDLRAMIAGYLTAGRLKLAQGDLDAAVRYLEQARPLVVKTRLPHWTGRFERLQLELWLAQDRLRAAMNWADDRLQIERLEGGLESEVAQLAMARVLILKGDAPSLERGMAYLQELIEAAVRQGRMGVQIEALALMALARQKRGEQPGAMMVLEQALRVAEPEGYVRLFTDIGLPMARLLQAARSRGVLPDYVDRLLAAFGAGLAFPTSHEKGLPEPLTPREKEILALLAAGLTNREIAEGLVISPETVKKHTGHIYGKLGVSNRTQAVARARELDMLT